METGFCYENWAQSSIPKHMCVCGNYFLRLKKKRAARQGDEQAASKPFFRVNHTVSSNDWCHMGLIAWMRLNKIFTSFVFRLKISLHSIHFHFHFHYHIDSTFISNRNCSNQHTKPININCIDFYQHWLSSIYQHKSSHKCLN